MTAKIVNDFRLTISGTQVLPIVLGGMGVNISTKELALEIARLGGIGHISDAMLPDVSDRLFGTRFTALKAKAFRLFSQIADKTGVNFLTDTVAQSTKQYVEGVMASKRGPGLIFINCMEKLTMNDSLGTLKSRLNAALDAGIDGITLSAGLHLHSFSLMQDNPRFRTAKLGIIVSSVRALRIFLRKTLSSSRLPDFIVVEGPLAGGHLGFGIDEWDKTSLGAILRDVLAFLEEQALKIPVIAAGGIFTGSDATRMLESGASGVQVATRFTVAKESGLPSAAKQAYFNAQASDIVVNLLSPTGYPMRMLSNSPIIANSVKPNCEAYGYLLDNGHCAYLSAYNEQLALHPERKVQHVCSKMCICSGMRNYKVWTCGATTARLRETSVRQENGEWIEPSAEHIFNDYLTSSSEHIALPVS